MMNVSLYISGICPNNSFPLHLRGDWYSIDQGEELHTMIEINKFSNELIDSAGCHDLYKVPGTEDAQGNYDAKVLLYNRLVMLHCQCIYEL